MPLLGEGAAAVLAAAAACGSADDGPVPGDGFAAGWARAGEARQALEELLEVKHPTAWVDFELGRIGGQEMLEQFFQDRRRYDHHGFERCVRRAYRYLDGMEELLEELAGAGRRPRAQSHSLNSRRSTAGK